MVWQLYRRESAAPQSLRAEMRRVDRRKSADHRARVKLLPSKRCEDAGFSAFALACSLLTLMAMCQLVVAAMALAVRFKESGRSSIAQGATVGGPIAPSVVLPTTTPVQDPAAAGVRPLVLPPSQILPEPSPVGEPAVADARVGRLLTEARQARVAGDMGKSIVKLEQALEFAPEDAAVLYELGLVHEQMGVYDRASEYYEKVFTLGLTKAGVLYQRAADKLRDGFAQPQDMLGKLSLARVRIFKNPAALAAEQVILTVPVQKSPTEQVEMKDIEVEVRFFNRNLRGDITELDDPSWAKSQWVSLPFDWAGGEELLRMTYTIPKVDHATAHLFGQKTYYGQVVTLSYQGEVLDVQAWPRDLAARIKRQPANGFGDSPMPEFQDALPPDFDPALPILPRLTE